MTAVANREDFERAFSAATVHDMFNWCSVGVLFTIEVRDPLIQTWDPLCTDLGTPIETFVVHMLLLKNLQF